jgi:hypothetical protein
MAAITISAPPRAEVEGYFPQLDGVRGLAVSLVVIQHGITLAVSPASWFLLEKPIFGWKRHFAC